jgi:hypothetical protein
MLQLKRVELEQIYPAKERERDIGKMKTYFEMRMNPMQRLASQPNGARLIEQFVLDPESIHQHQKFRKYFENPALHKVIEDLKHSHVETPFDSLIQTPAASTLPLQDDPLTSQLIEERVVSEKFFH